jgi:hypothetical protein
LGDFLPIGRLFTLGCFLTITETDQIFGLLQGKSDVFLLTKIGWVTFWAISSQTHLVILF